MDASAKLGAERVLVVGTGLIGGSVGMAVRRAGGSMVTGFDRSLAAAERARELGAVDEVTDDLASAAGEADLIVVAVPVGQIVPALALVAEGAAADTVVTDVGSTKSSIVAESERLFGPQRPFVGGHPMAGTEGEGIEAARPDLFDGALWLLTPTERTDPSAYRRVHGFVQLLGARALALDPHEHDRLVALVSHLPYAVSTTLMNLAADEADERAFRAAAGGFRDVTRTAGTNPWVWRDILATNRDAVLASLDAFSERLSALREALAAGRWDVVDELIASARAARDRFPVKGERTPEKPVTVDVPVPDRAGVLAEITTALGESDINIEDLWMEHTPSGGVVRLVVDGAPLADRAAAALTTRGFRATVLEDRA